MNVVILLYLASMIDHITNVSQAVIFVSGIVSLIMGVVWFTSIGDYHQDIHVMATAIIKTLYKKIWIPILAILILVFAPSERTMYLMIGASYLQSSPLPSKVAEILDLKLADIIAELKDKAKK